MKNLTLKRVPDSVHLRLKARAAAHHRSLNGEILSILEAAVEAEAREMPDAKVIIEEARALRRRLTGKRLTVEEIEAAVDEGRP